MRLAERNICVLAVATARVPDDCYFCGQREDEHVQVGRVCPIDLKPKQPTRHYHAIGWRDYGTLGLALGCYYSFADDLYTWFDPLSLAQTIDTFLLRRPLLVSYQGASFSGPLLWQCYRESPDGNQAHALSAAAVLNMQRGWDELLDDSYDLLEEILATYPDMRFERDAISLDQICRATLGKPRLLNAFLFAPLWRRGFFGQALTALHFDVWAMRALFERICNGQVLTLGNGTAVTLPIPPSLREQP